MTTLFLAVAFLVLGSLALPMALRTFRPPPSTRPQQPPRSVPRVG